MMKDSEMSGSELLPEFLTPGEAAGLLSRWGLGGRYYLKKLTEAGELKRYDLPLARSGRYRSEEVLRLRERVRGN